MNTIFTILMVIGFTIATFGVVVGAPIIAVFGGFFTLSAALARDEPPRA